MHTFDYSGMASKGELYCVPDSQGGMLARYLVVGKEMILFLFKEMLLGVETPVTIGTEAQHVLHQVVSSL